MTRTLTQTAFIFIALNLMAISTLYAEEPAPTPNPSPVEAKPVKQVEAVPVKQVKATPPPVDPMTLLNGTWVLAQSKKKTMSSIHAQIEKIVDDMNFIKRPFARSRLKDTTVPCNSITLENKGNKNAYTCNRLKAEHTTIGGKKHAIKSQITDDMLVVSLTKKGRKLDQKRQLKGEKSYRINSYEVSKDGKKMTLRVTLYSPSLPRKLKYQAIYKKK